MQSVEYLYTEKLGSKAPSLLYFCYNMGTSLVEASASAFASASTIVTSRVSS